MGKIVDPYSGKRSFHKGGRGSLSQKKVPKESVKDILKEYIKQIEDREEFWRKLNIPKP